MIARLRGELVARQPPTLLIDVGGVGYELAAPMSTFYRLPAAGAAVSLLTHLVVRDDAHVLYGFATEPERALFRDLIRVNGVGPKMALAILSGVSVADFIACAQNRDVAALTRLPGIGKKTAERLLVDMQDRLGGPAAVAAAPAGPLQDAVSALVALGYKRADADRMVRAVAGADGGGEGRAESMDSAELIRYALKAVAR